MEMFRLQAAKNLTQYLDVLDLNEHVIAKTQQIIQNKMNIDSESEVYSEFLDYINSLEDKE